MSGLRLVVPGRPHAEQPVPGCGTAEQPFFLIAGPCAVENEAMIRTAARAVADAGATLLRGGVFKPRTSPYAFQGLGHEGLRLLADAGAEVGLPIITEVMDTRDVEAVAAVADVLQIGSRNMQNFALLREVGRSGAPVMLKRGLMSTIDEFLNAAEYIAAEGNHRILLCERGIRSFDARTRNTLDLSAVPVLQELTSLPVIVDPSHATGRTELVEPMALAGVAAGAQGIMVEVHPNPAQALSDAGQALTPDQFARLAERITSLRAWRDETA